jgi:hypothetical protein
MYRKSFQETGDTTDSCWSAGTVMGLIHDVPSCQELLDRMMREREQTNPRAQGSPVRRE